MANIDEFAKLSLLLESKLSERGILNVDGLLMSASLPPDIEEKLDGLIDNIAELEGLIRIAHAARQGETLSPPVAGAVRVMIEEICDALFEPEELRNLSRLH
ncbi:hypothetical protein [Rhizobium sp. YS-1r]|uniref:Uncharacterized protein n=1 Tax=Neorhizobium phenanthreniclasticum TaxID=3157917 RepID=A0ABV0M657_9HYPH|nr:hypothetical protein [Rhizobium sp. YS-1r]